MDTDPKLLANSKRSTGVVGLRYVVALGFFGVAVVLVVLTVVAMSVRTWNFVLLGLSGVTMCSAIGALFWITCTKKRRVLGVIAACSLLPLALYSSWRVPAQPNKPILNRSVGGDSAPWLGGIPEGELIRLGELIGWGAQERRSLKGRGVWTNYSEIKASAPFERPYSYVVDCWFVDRGHYWLAPAKGEAKAILVFLHGSGGNFQAYPYWVHKAASEAGIVSVYPTWGFGTWTPRYLAKRVEAVLGAVRDELDLPDVPYVLCGLSQGGINTFPMVGSGATKPDGVVTISGACWPREQWLDVTSTLPVLMFHGAKDSHVTVGTSREWTEVLQARSGRVTYHEYKDSDHALLHLKHEEIVAEMLRWIADEVIERSLPSQPISD